jgi:hypothetical protein
MIVGVTLGSCITCRITSFVGATMIMTIKQLYTALEAGKK